MIEWIKDGDLFASGCEGLVNPVNTEGVMGKGLAAEFKRRWPAMFVNYQAACRLGTLTIGSVQPCKVDNEGGELWISTFPPRTAGATHRSWSTWRRVSPTCAVRSPRWS